jgi:hypothetical protein
MSQQKSGSDGGFSLTGKGQNLKIRFLFLANERSLAKRII